MESDALAVVNAIRSPLSLADLGLLVFNIQNILVVFPGFSVEFVRREANKAAHILSKFALSVEVDHFWMEDYPPYVCTQLLEDWN
ncbi:hypothetical protein ACOSP7_010215 [Xanthoceras sorbifolium]